MTAMWRCMWLALAIGTVVSAAGTSDVAAGPPPAKDAVKAFKLEPPLQRAGKELLEAMRALSLLQQKAVDGDSDALKRQAPLAQDISTRLAGVAPETWKSAELRHALMKFVLSGGDPTVLQRLVTSKTVTAPEMPLALGAIAYASGDPLEAAENLAKVEPRALPPSLGGHVALLSAVSGSDGDKEAAMALCDEARLLSPGTIVEETALRLTIELAIATGSRERFRRSVVRYLSRFPKSQYATEVLERIASVAAVASEATSPPELAWLADLGSVLSPERRGALFGDLAEAALRSGRLQIAEKAAGLALGQDRQQGAARARLLAIEAAAIVFARRPADASRLLAEAESASPDPETAELTAAVRQIASIMSAPAVPAPPDGAPPQGNGSVTGKGARPQIGGDTSDGAKAESRLKALAARTQGALSAADQLIGQASR